MLLSRRHATTQASVVDVENFSRIVSKLARAIEDKKSVRCFMVVYGGRCLTRRFGGTFEYGDGPLEGLNSGELSIHPRFELPHQLVVVFLRHIGGREALVELVDETLEGVFDVVFEAPQCAIGTHIDHGEDGRAAGGGVSGRAHVFV